MTEQTHATELPSVDNQGAETPTIQVACPTADEVSADYAPGVDRSSISDYAELVLRQICSRACIRSVQVSSGLRSPESQARAMYGNAQSTGLDHQRRLYGLRGNQVLDQFEQGVAQGHDATTIQHDMADVIRQHPDAFHHVARTANLNVFDVAPSSVGSRADGQRFAREAQADARVVRFFQPPNDPGFHFEIEGQ